MKHAPCHRRLAYPRPPRSETPSHLLGPTSSCTTEHVRVRGVTRCAPPEHRALEYWQAVSAPREVYRGRLQTRREKTREAPPTLMATDTHGPRGNLCQAPNLGCSAKRSVLGTSPPLCRHMRPTCCYPRILRFAAGAADPLPGSS
jgi:hypothetical protein